MKRSYVLSALVLGLALATSAGCGGGAAAGDGAKGPDGQASDGKSPVEELEGLSKGIQDGVDDILKPINDADAAIQAVADLPKELKVVIKGKAKFDAKKLGAAAAKIMAGEEPDVASLGLEAEAEAKAKVEDAFGKLKAVVNGIKTTDEKVKALGEKLQAAVLKVPELVAKVTATVQITLKNPLAGAEAKAKAEADMGKVKEIGDGFVKKADEWKKTFTELPAKAAAAKDKMAKAFTSLK